MAHPSVTVYRTRMLVRCAHGVERLNSMRHIRRSRKTGMTEKAVPHGTSHSSSLRQTTCLLPYHAWQTTSPKGPLTIPLVCRIFEQSPCSITRIARRQRAFWQTCSPEPGSLQMQRRSSIPCQEHAFRWESGSTSLPLALLAKRRQHVRSWRLTCRWRCAVLPLHREVVGSTRANCPEL
jgi:hypothetical protein